MLGLGCVNTTEFAQPNHSQNDGQVLFSQGSVPICTRGVCGDRANCNCLRLNFQREKHSNLSEHLGGTTPETEAVPAAVL